MERRFIRIISAILAILFVLTTIGCNSQKQPNTDDRADTSDIGEISFTLNAEYNIVSHSLYKKTADIANALSLVKSSLSACGIGSFLTTDNSSSGEKPETAEFEILIGYTGREESQDALESLGVNDYVYRIVSENVIVICGGTAEATYKAAEKFCVDVLGYDTKTKKCDPQKAKLSVASSTEYIYRDTYEYDTLTINEIDIKDFCIAVSSTQDMIHAQNIIKKFGSYTGFGIPVVQFSELCGDEKAVICINAFSRDQSDFYDSLVLGGAIKLNSEPSKLTLGLDAYSTDYYDSLLSDLFSKSKITENNTSISFTLPEKDIEFYDLDSTYGEMPEWILVNERKETVRDGVTYIERSYKDEKSKPYKAYILMIDPDKASLYMGSTNDEYTPTPKDRQSVIGHMQSAVSNGVDVIAGTNGGFFYISSDYSPIGLTVKEGELIASESPSRAYCGFTKDGKMIIEKDAHSADIDNLRTAIGGRNMIVHKGLPYELERNDDFGTTSHPRTLAGVMEDGTMILAVIDGRQSKHSNGAPLSVCARFMIDLGAYDAINLDGGGSSTMVIRNGDEYDVKNSPSDGSPRKIFNSMLVIAKDN